MDYRILGMMHDVDCGRVSAAAGWDMDWIPAEHRGEAIELWRTTYGNRLRVVVFAQTAEGYHFEHLL